MRYNNILEAIGRTPLIRLSRLGRGSKGEIWAKCDYLNPGGSVKDRIAVTMIDEAERQGLLEPGGTIVEGTSGNTGMGLALVAVTRGYQCIFTMTDKQSKEKADLLKALGADVIVCPTAVPVGDPRSYHQVAEKLAHEIPNAYHPDQYSNPANTEAHYRTTGPEIWEDSEGKITHLVLGIGTGGTITGLGRYLKERNPNVKIIGVDPVGSILYDYFKTGKLVQAEPYKTEGIGEDFFPPVLDFKVIDDMIQVSDKESFLWARRLARTEGVFAGGSSGTVIAGAMRLAPSLAAGDFMVVFIADTGMRYLSKIYSSEWMRDNRYLESSVPMTAGDIVRAKRAMGPARQLVEVAPSDTVAAALERMQRHDLSQLPVFEDGHPVGAIYEDAVLSLALDGKDLKQVVVREAMNEGFPVVSPSAAFDQITGFITHNCPAVFVDMGGLYEILTKYDLLHAIARRIGG